MMNKEHRVELCVNYKLDGDVSSFVYWKNRNGQGCNGEFSSRPGGRDVPRFAPSFAHEHRDTVLFRGGIEAYDDGLGKFYCFPSPVLLYFIRY